jgi:hypothetical protein
VYLVAALDWYSRKFLSWRVSITMDVHFCLEALEEAINVQRFLNIHAAVYNFFNLGRHLVSAEAYRFFRLRSFACWKNSAAVYLAGLGIWDPGQLTW